MKCPICKEEFEPKRKTATVCKKAKCIKAAQRLKKAGEKSPPITQNPSGLPGGPSSTSSPSVPDQGPDVPTVECVRNPRYDELGSEADVKFVFHPAVVRVPSEKEAKKLLKNFKKNIKDVWETKPDTAVFIPPVPLPELLAKADPALWPEEVEQQAPSLAQSVLSRLSTKLPSKAPVVPRGTPILSGKPKGPSKTSGK
jgi:hypothetical protein